MNSAPTTTAPAFTLSTNHGTWADVSVDGAEVGYIVWTAGAGTWAAFYVHATDDDLGGFIDHYPTRFEAAAAVVQQAAATV